MALCSGDWSGADVTSTRRRVRAACHRVRVRVRVRAACHKVRHRVRAECRVPPASIVYELD